MPLNKNASFRYRVIDHCLGKRFTRHTINDLVREVSEALFEQFGVRNGVSKRTIQSDIQIMRSQPPRGFGAEIVCESGEYYYSIPGYSILNAPLNTTDINLLKEISLLLSEFKYLPHFERLNEMLGKLKGYTARQLFEKNIISLEIKQFVAGTEYLPLIFDALLQKKQLRIDYKPFTEAMITVVVHPYLLKEYNNRWYLLCDASHREGLSVLALDRIKGIQHLEIAANVCPIDISTYYNNVIGVSIPENAQMKQVKFSINNDRLPYIETKPLHTSQKIELIGDRFFVSLQIIINKELKATLLSLCPDIVVLHPPELVREIKAMLKKSLTKHTEK